MVDRLPLLEPDLSLAHLNAELARIDVRLGRAIRRWQLAGQDPADAFRGSYVSDEQANALLARPLATSWGQTVKLDADEAAEFADAQARADNAATRFVDAAHREGHTLRLEQLASAFDLDQFDLDALLICLAPTLDLRYEPLYGYLQDDVTRKRPSVNLILDLFCEPGLDRLQMLTRFAADAPLIKHELLERTTERGSIKPSLLSQTLVVDEAVVSWLLGKYQPHADLRPFAILEAPQVSGKDELLAAQALFEDADTERPIIAMYGPDQAGQMAAARLRAARMDRPLLTIDLAAARKAELPLLRIIRLALRDARLTGAALQLTGWDECFDRQAGDAPPADMLQALCEHPGPIVMSSCAAWQFKGIDRARPLRWIEFPVPSYAQRLELWKHFVCDTSPDGRVEELDVTGVAGQFRLTSGQIRDAVSTARDSAVQRGAPLQVSDLFAAARAHSNPRLASLAHKIEPHFRWEDIVLPVDRVRQLLEICNHVKYRAVVYDEWGFDRKLALGKGLNVLFAGSSGTGKTMAAEIMAHELGLDLYKIDLSTVVSKYIGETEKNLSRIFAEAETSNAILFFDEADALFGKRSEVRDAHDRYANIEISYLLQRMEEHQGIVILATNLRKNMDDAFVRRMHFTVEFPFPSEADRRRIWEKIWPAETPRSPALDLDFAARRFELAGGNIRNIAVAAAFLAASDGRVVDMKHLIHATKREYQKIGKVVTESEFSTAR